MAVLDVRRYGKLARSVADLKAQIVDARQLQVAFQDWALHSLDPALQDVLSNKILRRRTGFLARSTFFQSLRATKSQVYVSVVTAHYGPVHEYGATIKPRRKKWLTVPLPAAQTPAGVTRYAAPDYPGAFLIKSRTGKLFIVKRGKKPGKLDFLFALKKEVKIPARKWFSTAAKQALEYLPYYLSQYLEA